MHGEGGSGLQATFSKVTDLAEVELPQDGACALTPQEERTEVWMRASLLHNPPCSKFLPYAEPDLPFGATENTQAPFSSPLLFRSRRTHRVPPRSSLPGKPLPCHQRMPGPQAFQPSRPGW